MEIALIIVSCICTVIIPFAISLAVDNKNRRKREKAKDEISNYVFGQIDIWDITPREELKAKKEGK